MKNPYQVVNQYKAIDLKTRVDAADPHELINMLLQGARNHIAAAQGCMARGQLAEKGEHLSKTLSIIAGLKSSLDHDGGGEVATNLLKIYDYMEPLVLQANLYNDPERLVEVNQLLTQIHDAWKEISPASVES